MIKGVTNAHLRPIWCHSGPSDVPISPNQFLGQDFFCRFLQQTGSILLCMHGFYTKAPTTMNDEAKKI